MTLLCSPGIRLLFAWLEQILAESTGKDWRGLIPVDGEEPGPPEVYRCDHLFVYVSIEDELDAPNLKTEIEELEKAGQPVIRLALPDRHHIRREFYRWMFATAVAGSVMGINPFDQPDVESSKIAARKLTAEYERTGSLPHEIPLLEERGIALFPNEKNAAYLHQVPAERQFGFNR